jgi:hypothetical protein
VREEGISVERREESREKKTEKEELEVGRPKPEEGKDTSG